MSFFAMYIDRLSLHFPLLSTAYRAYEVVIVQRCERLQPACPARVHIWRPHVSLPSTSEHVEVCYRDTIPDPFSGRGGTLPRLGQGL